MTQQNIFIQNESPEVFVDLTYDSGFKAVFADESNKHLLIGLLNNVLPPEAHVSDIKRYLDREQGRDTLLPTMRLLRFGNIPCNTQGIRQIFKVETGLLHRFSELSPFS